MPAPTTIECSVHHHDYTNCTDNCGTPTLTFADVTVPGSCPNEYSITRTWTATDACGNTAILSQTINVEDNISPTASNPTSISVQCNGNVPAPDITVVTDETDNCPGAVVVAFVDDQSNGATCPEVITSTYSVTDACGNQILVTQLINVGDDIPPTASNPLPINGRMHMRRRHLM